MCNNRFHIPLCAKSESICPTYSLFTSFYSWWHLNILSVDSLSRCCLQCTIKSFTLCFNIIVKECCFFFRNNCIWVLCVIYVKLVRWSNLGCFRFLFTVNIKAFKYLKLRFDSDNGHDHPRLKEIVIECFKYAEYYNCCF